MLSMDLVHPLCDVYSNEMSRTVTTGQAGVEADWKTKDREPIRCDPRETEARLTGSLYQFGLKDFDLVVGRTG